MAGTGGECRFTRRMALAVLLAALVCGLLAGPVAAHTVYVANLQSNSVSVIDTETREVRGEPIPVDLGPMGITITPDGRRTFVVNTGAKSISVIDARENVVTSTISLAGVSGLPVGIGITPDGARGYIPNTFSGGLSVIDLLSGQLVVPRVAGTEEPSSVALTPDGRYVYMTNGTGQENNVTVVDTRTNQLVGAPIVGGTNPAAVAITPNGRTAYVANAQSHDISVIDTATNQLAGLIPLNDGGMLGPHSIAINPDGKRAYVISYSGQLSVIDTATNTVVDSSVHVGSFSGQIAITPDGLWAYVPDIGSDSVWVVDLTKLRVVGAPIPVGDEPRAAAVAPALPGVRIGCPKLADSACTLELQAVTKRRRAQSRVARARLGRGRSRVVRLTPEPVFAYRLATAHSLLVKGKLRAKGLRKNFVRRVHVIPPR